MGAYSPSRLINDDLEDKILTKIIKPTLKGLSNIGTEYKGFLYAGLMIVKDEPFLIEYNVRMGDPECQTLLPKLKTDFGLLIKACIEEKLIESEIEWYNDKSLCIVLCSKGYPDKYKNNIELNVSDLNLDKFEFLFHAGTTMVNKKIFATGGRVLNFVSLSEDFKLAKNNLINNLNELNWTGGFYRSDIGYKVIE